MFSKQLNFQIRKCNDRYRDSNASKCHDSTIIDEYVEDIEVGVWEMSNSIEFGNMDNLKPLLNSMES
jgi:hypothetical protein